MEKVIGKLQRKGDRITSSDDSRLDAAEMQRVAKAAGRPVKATASPKQAAKNQQSRAKYAGKKPK